MTRECCNIHLVAGTRPNIVKVAPLYRVLAQQQWCTARLVYVQQHNSPNMSTEIFEDFGISEMTPVSLSATGYGPRVGQIIEQYQSLCQQDWPDMVVVFGDVDVSMAVTLAAKRLGITVVHLEAGLRSGDIDMPEEVNRIVIDSIADILLAPSEDALQNLIFGEGKSREKVEFVGNIMIDSLVSTLAPDVQRPLLEEHGLERDRYAVATFHRPSNVDSPAALATICDLLCWLADRTKVLFPAHPRTMKQLELTGLVERLKGHPSVRLVPALRYASFVNLVAASTLVLTDSGGIQEETTFMGVPCLTFRDTTERPVTIRAGTNILVNEFDVRARVEQVLAGTRFAKGDGATIPLWDGATAYRCAAILNRWWGQRLRPHRPEGVGEQAA